MVEKIAIYISQLIIVLGIINVWFLRKNKETHYRGSEAQTLEEEFKVYGYPRWFFYLIGTLKIIFALFIGGGFWFEIILPIGAIGMTILMLGAVISHLKVNDPLKKFMPATIMLALSLFILTNSL